MRIISIQLNKDCQILRVGGVSLTGVILTVKGFWGSLKTVKAFPTNHGVASKNDVMMYYYFTDELGRELDDEISKQINAYLMIQKLLGTFDQ